ncbi:hypothetical protein ACE1TH_08960 [Shouchella sp. JSM 1781072]
MKTRRQVKKLVFFVWKLEVEGLLKEMNQFQLVGERYLDSQVQITV